jgi:hypothetical protein
VTEKETGAKADVQEDAAAKGEAPSPEEIEAEIAEKREELGDTVAALADKADVKKQAKRKVEETKERAQEKVGAAAESAKQTFESAPETASQLADRTLARARENPPAAIAAVGGVLLLLFLIRRRR